MEHEPSYKVRLSQPRFDLVERQFACRAPEPLRRLYADHDELFKMDFVVQFRGKPDAREMEMYISSYNPIDEKYLGAFEGFEMYMGFADDRGRGIYFINPTEFDPYIYYFTLEGHELYPMGITLSEYLKLPRIELPEDE